VTHEWKRKIYEVNILPVHTRKHGAKLSIMILEIVYIYMALEIEAFLF